MADKFIIIFSKKASPSKGYFRKVASPVFDTKTEARKFAVKVMKEKPQFFSAFITTTACVGEKGQYYGTDHMRWSTSNETIDSRTVKNRKVYYIRDTFRYPATVGKIVKADGTLSNEKIDDWTAKRDPHYWDLDIDPLKIKKMLNARK